MLSLGLLILSFALFAIRSLPLNFGYQRNPYSSTLSVSEAPFTCYRPLKDFENAAYLGTVRAPESNSSTQDNGHSLTCLLGFYIWLMGPDLALQSINLGSVIW